jgi:hypothetical protein
MEDRMLQTLRRSQSEAAGRQCPQPGSAINLPPGRGRILSYAPLSAALDAMHKNGIAAGSNGICHFV